MQIATRLSKAASTSADSSPAAVGDGDGRVEDANGGFIPVGDKGGRVRFIELDAEKMGDYFTSTTSTSSNGKDGGGFDVVWITEALSHFPDKALFFRNAHRLLRPRGGKLVLADWFKAEGLGEGAFEADIKPIEGLFPPPFLFSVSPSSLLL